MEQKDIIIEGININEFYDELWEKRQKIRQEASQVISDNLELAQSLTRQLIDSKESEEIKTLANQAYQALRNVKIVSEVSSVQFYLPYSSNYDSRRDILSRVLDDAENELLNNMSEIENLQQLFRELEYQSGEWNTSFC